MLMLPDHEVQSSFSLDFRDIRDRAKVILAASAWGCGLVCQDSIFCANGKLALQHSSTHGYVRDADRRG